MDLGPFVTLAVVWAVLSLFGKIAGSAKKQQQRQGGTGGPPVARRDERATMRRQPETFEELLAEMRGQIEGRRETPTPTWESADEDQEDVEDRRTSEEVPEVISLETGWEREQRIDTFSDAEEAERLIRRRIDAAAARDHGWRASDHRAFDDRIREPVVVAPRVRMRPDLHQAMIWREVLGPPVSMRPREPLTRGDG